MGQEKKKSRQETKFCRGLMGHDLNKAAQFIPKLVIHMLINSAFMCTWTGCGVSPIVVNVSVDQ